VGEWCVSGSGIEQAGEQVLFLIVRVLSLGARLLGWVIEHGIPTGGEDWRKLWQEGLS